MYSEKEAERISRDAHRDEREARGGIGAALRESIAMESGAEGGVFRLWMNLLTVALGFVFGGCHILFGAYPLGLALVSALPSSVFIASVGVVLGSLSLGRAGVIYALIALLAVFLRVIISGSDRGLRDSGQKASPRLFSESVGLRVSSAVISGFVGAIYEVLLSGFSTESVLFGAAMVILPAAFAALFSGAFSHGVGLRTLIFGNGRVFRDSNAKPQRWRSLHFKIALISIGALVSFGLKRYEVFGIDLAFIFAGIATLFAAKRFGAIYGAVTGFSTSVLVSGALCPAYALAGAAAGALFPIGSWYAIAAAGILTSLWGAYTSGVSGFLTLFPEFIISASALTPILRSLERERLRTDTDEPSENIHRLATDMVGTMALAYRNRQSIVTEGIESAIRAAADAASGYGGGEGEYSAVLKLVTDAKDVALMRRELDGELTDKLEYALSELRDELFALGDDFVIRAFGDRRKYMILAFRDKDGTSITSPKIKEKIEEASGFSVSRLEYYRRDEMAMAVCEATDSFILQGAFARSAGASGEVSGDSVNLIKSKELFTYGIICDGMGSGKEAKRASELSIDLLSSSLGGGCSLTSAVHLLNAVLRRGRDECSVALDLFSFDLIRGEACFLKSGAAPSYIKRRDSLFRIKSETMPLGVIKTVDAERIDVKVEAGDHIIMFSDGVSDNANDAPWLVALLNRPPEPDLAKYAESILAAAKREREREHATADDMTVLVMRVGKKS